MPSAREHPRPLWLAVACGGAATFVVALFVAGYAYLFAFDRRLPQSSTPTAIVVDVLLFSVFALHHSALARAPVKRRVAQLVPPELVRSVYTWTASLLLIAVCLLWQAVPGTLYTLHGPWRVAAWMVQIIGVVLTARGSAALDVLDLAGVRQVMHGAGTRAVPHVRLETQGLYGFVRHPLYFAWALMVLATPDMTATRATFALVSTAYVALAIPWEERTLLDTFGPAYENYRRRVRWRMIPGLY